VRDSRSFGREAMKTRDIIKGIEILEKYRQKQDGFDISAEHDVIYCSATDSEVSEADLIVLIELGWFQEGVYGENDFSLSEYDLEEPWTCYP
jgi:hypothetical protein